VWGVHCSTDLFKFQKEQPSRPYLSNDISEYFSSLQGGNMQKKALNSNNRILHSGLFLPVTIWAIFSRWGDFWTLAISSSKLLQITMLLKNKANRCKIQECDKGAGAIIFPSFKFLKICQIHFQLFLATSPVLRHTHAHTHTQEDFTITERWRSTRSVCCWDPEWIWSYTRLQESCSLDPTHHDICTAWVLRKQHQF
jgi:hypothetical protein